MLHGHSLFRDYDEAIRNETCKGGVAAQSRTIITMTQNEQRKKHKPLKSFDFGGMKCHDIKKIQSVAWNLSIIDKQDKTAPAPSLASLHLC